jgi:hypothetical protein
MHILLMNYWTNHDLSTSAQSPKRVRSTLAIVDVGNFVVGSKIKRRLYFDQH